MDSLHTTKFDPDTSDLLVQFVFDRQDASNANVRMQYKNTADTTVQLFQIAGGLPFGTKVRMIIEKDATNFIFTFDDLEVLGSRVIKLIARASVRAGRPNAFLHALDMFATLAFTHHATSRFDNVSGLKAA